MSVHLIIDGYNVIRRSAVLGSLDQQDIQWGRDALLDRLAAYKRIKSHKITVVFDGANSRAPSRHRDHFKGIRIRFSRGGETADTVIKRMVETEREKALVVSSDRDLVNHAVSKGAAAVSSPVFEEKVAMAEYMDSKGGGGEDDSGWIPTTKKKGPRRRRSKKERRSRVKIRKL
jgi:predicted RNA-binding protein with PIN domain